jgi:hypothetical protein
MKFIAHFYQLNDDFSQEYADTHNKGKDSEMNRRYDWEDELALKNDVEKVNVLKSASYTLAGQFGNGESFSEEVSGMLRFDIIGKDGSVTTMACSESMLSHYELEESADKMLLKVFIKDYEPFANPIPGIYIASQDFPTNLITE